jgi:hypothetical protein
MVREGKRIVLKKVHLDRGICEETLSSESSDQVIAARICPEFGGGMFLEVVQGIYALKSFGRISQTVPLKEYELPGMLAGIIQQSRKGEFVCIASADSYIAVAGVTGKVFKVAPRHEYERVYSLAGKGGYLSSQTPTGVIVRPIRLAEVLRGRDKKKRP